MTGTVKTFEPKVRFRLVPFEDITVSTDRDYLIKGLFQQTGLAVVWGPPASGKSFWTFNAAMHIALGWEYCGRRVQQRPICYVAGEGQHGFGKRVAAFRQEFMAEDHGPVPFHLLGEPVDVIGDHGALIQDIRAQLGDQTPGMVVLDTLSRTLRGDENSSEDMGKYVAAADSIRDAFACCTTIVHHCGHDGSRPRGFSGLTAAADMQFAISAVGEARSIEVEKNKDGPKGDRLSFRLRSVEIATDADGDPITSCVVAPSDSAATEPAAVKLTDNQRTMLTILQEAGPAGLTWPEWNGQAKDAGVARTREASRFDARAALKRKKLVHESQNGRWHVTTH